MGGVGIPVPQVSSDRVSCVPVRTPATTQNDKDPARKCSSRCPHRQGQKGCCSAICRIFRLYVVEYDIGRVCDKGKYL